MKFRFLIFLSVFLSLPVFRGFSQNKQDNVCYINNDRIYFQLDKRWPEPKKKEISALFSLDSALIELAFTAGQSFVYDSIEWQVNPIDANLLELSKTIAEKKQVYNPNDLILLDDKIFFPAVVFKPIFAPARRFGINNFSKGPGVHYTGDTAHFILAAYPKAQQVYLSGTFNNWSTMQNAMRRTGSGWELSITLAPGRYLYKFIVDGKWIHDPANLQKENDLQAGYNSVLYCYNHVFKLQGYTKAKKVIVTGSFNGWKRNQLRMNAVPGGWALPVYLEQGTHAYKFIVDGTWMNDPDNRIVRADADGNFNSFMGIGDTLVFRLKGFASANSVVLAGSFNAWSTNELVMNKTDDGWELPYVIGAGVYEYKFIVDGQWMTDPANPLTTGSGAFANSVITFKPNFTFRLAQFADAKKVIVTGSFNDWREDAYVMTLTDGIWTCPVFLKPGKYTYKFIVDGKWLIDPGNENWEGNQHGTGNSVLWIEP